MNVFELVQSQAWDVPWFWMVLPLFLILLITVCWLTIKLIAQLRFDIYATSMTADDFREIVHLTAYELNWIILRLEDRAFEGERVGNGLEGAELITIKRTGKQLRINSIPHPRRWSNSPDFARNKENKLTFVYNAAAFLRGEDIFQVMEDRKKREEENFWKASEWTPRTLAKRLLAYGFIVLFLFLAWISLYEAPLIGVLFLLIGGGLGGIYIWSDIQMILNKREYQAQAKDQQN
ncbi:MAG: hypothetical protein KTR30_06390 [Saprospiraceae bacterium]|nr:hypothetical protein [Saprospiraceae bacterium]